MTFGIPYMGSKRKLAKPILDYILQCNPRCKYFFDLFGGGGAISFEALQRKEFKQVFYNELNTGVVELLKKIKKDGITKEFYQWIDRETFNKNKYGSDWFAGLCKCIWSFGNNQEAYLFGKDIEELKKDATEYLFKNGYLENRQADTRIRLLKEFKEKEKIKGRFDLQSLESLQRLQSLESLESLQRLQSLESLEITNLSYEEVIIDTPISETVIYLDPPYDKCLAAERFKNKENYYKTFNPENLNNYIKNNKYKIYLSSYVSEFPCVLEIEHRSTLSATANNKVIEKLFCNRKEEIIYNKHNFVNSLF